MVLSLYNKYYYSIINIYDIKLMYYENIINKEFNGT